MDASNAFHCNNARKHARKFCACYYALNHYTKRPRKGVIEREHSEKTRGNGIERACQKPPEIQLECRCQPDYTTEPPKKGTVTQYYPLQEVTKSEKV